MKTGLMVGAGALITLVLVGYVPAAQWMLPGIWQVIFSLGVFSASRFLPRQIAAAGAWYLVRAWRLQSKLKLAGGGSKSSYGPPNSRTSTNRLPSAGGVLPRPNKRYTPPTEKLKRPSKPQG